MKKINDVYILSVWPVSIGVFALINLFSAFPGGDQTIGHGFLVLTVGFVGLVIVLFMTPRLIMEIKGKAISTPNKLLFCLNYLITILLIILMVN